MVELKTSGDFNKTFKYLQKLNDVTKNDILDRYGRIGVDALKLATPKDTGNTAESWGYKIVKGNNSIKLVFTNSNKTSTGTPIVILLQYGHGTGSGGYVYGRDFINPALQPVFEKLADEIWEEVKRL